MELPEGIAYNTYINNPGRTVKTMAGGTLVTEYDSVDTSNQISLKQFPPKLRKLAKKLLESDSPMTVSDACTELKLNIDSIYSMITRCRRNGNDFTQFIQEQSQALLHTNRIGVYRSVINQAVSSISTAHNQQKLFSQLVGDVKDDVRINGQITLAIGINTSAISPQDQDRNKGIIDVEPMVPRGK